MRSFKDGNWSEKMVGGCVGFSYRQEPRWQGRTVSPSANGSRTVRKPAGLPELLDFLGL